MIQAPDPFEGINSWLGKLLAAKQQQEIHKEQLKIREKELALKTQEYQQQEAIRQAELAKTQGPQLAAQQFLQAQAQQAAAPALAQYSPMSGQMMAAPQMGEPAPQAAVQYGQLQADPQTKLAAAPDFAKQAQAQVEERKVERYLQDLKRHMSSDEFSRFSTALRLKQTMGDAMTADMVKPFIPETAMQKAERLKVLADTRETASKTDSDMVAQKYLAERYGIVVAPHDAQKTLLEMTLADRRHGQALELARVQNEGQRNNEVLKIQNSMRSDFEGSQVVKTAQTMASSYAKIVNAAARKTGADDTALIFQFINMQDQTAARDSERQALQKAGSLDNYITAKFGKWSKGTVLADEVRQNIVDASKAMLDAHMGSLSAYTDWYNEIAKSAGVDPTKVTYDPVNRVVQQAQDEVNRAKLNRVMQKRVK